MQNRQSIKLSIIIPYYNQGLWLLEALDSVLSLPENLVEIIVVNDGSTDPISVETLQKIPKDRVLLIEQNNQGLASARNTGIKAARGEYILPLDSDNKIIPEYAFEGIRVLDSDPTVGVVYGERISFGGNDARRKWKTFKFNPHAIMFINMIDACAVYRKKIWEMIGGYDDNMRMGHEDWDFWVRTSGTPYSFYYLNKEMFYYRISENSMITKMDVQKRIQNWGYMIQKNAALYQQFYFQSYHGTFNKILRLSKFKFFLIRVFLKFLSFV